MTAVLCECAFIDNDVDNDIIDTVAEQKAFGVAYAKAILEYLNIPYKETVSDSKLYRVQIGAYSKKENAEAMLAKVKAAGFNDAFVKYI
jgi:N-acetylmuramoyl-L-alanine amidase